MKYLKMFEKFSPSPERWPDMDSFEVTLVDLFDIFIEDARKLSKLYDKVMEEDNIDKRMNIIEQSLIDMDLEDKYPEIWDDLEDYIKNWATE
jgi:hypothetical protein